MSRRYRGLYSRLLCREIAPQEPASELQRLLLLENAVLNYGGGLAVLQGRVEEQASRLQADSPEATVLGDVARYLRDVAEAGYLDTRDIRVFLWDE